MKTTILMAVTMNSYSNAIFAAKSILLILHL